MACWRSGSADERRHPSGQASEPEGGTIVSVSRSEQAPRLSDKDLATVATLIDGANDSGHDTVVDMTWRNRTSGEAGGFAASLPSDAAV